MGTIKDLLKKTPEAVKIYSSKSFDLAVLLRTVLEQRNLSKSDFAKLVKKDNAVITRWLSGTHNFTFQTISEIEAELGMNLISIDAIKIRRSLSKHIKIETEGFEDLEFEEARTNGPRRTKRIGGS